MGRPKVTRGGGSYFATPSKDVEFVSSGCELLNCVLGGGWPLGRIVNIVGDKSTGKTLLAIEAFANFQRAYPSGRLYYNEAESAFDKSYAKALGLPVDAVEFVEGCETVEQLFDDLQKKCSKLLRRHSGIYVLDSLDALTDKAELDRDISDDTYGGTKAKQMSQLFRRLVRQLAESRMLLVVVSQVRDKIGARFGVKYTRSGGRALDFYASQVLYLAQMGTIRKKAGKVERAVGVTIKAKCTKNKIGLPLRECQFDIKFGYGVDDVAAGLTWLEEIGRLDVAGLNKAQLPGYLKRYEEMSATDSDLIRARIAAVVRTQWSVVEQDFLPKRGKYR